MARPNWEYIRVDVLLPDHPKLDGLGAAAKWTLIELWCHCGQRLSDGFVRDAAWRRFGTASIRRQLVQHGLAHAVPGGYQMHDYLEHQRSRDEVTAMKASRSKAGKRSAEERAKARALAEQDAQHPVEQDEHGQPVDNSVNGVYPDTREHCSETETIQDPGAEKNGHYGDIPRPASRCVQQDVEQTRSKPATEAEAEADIRQSRVDAVGQSSLRNARKSDDDLIDLIISEIHLATGRDVSRDWAADVRATLINGRDVTNPAAYLRQIIRTERDPAARFLPLATSHPSAVTVAQAAIAAGITPNGTPLRGDSVAAIAAHARAAIRTRPETPNDP